MLFLMFLNAFIELKIFFKVFPLQTRENPVNYTSALTMRSLTTSKYFGPHLHPHLALFNYTKSLEMDVKIKCKQGQTCCAQVQHATNITLLASISWSPTPPPLWHVLMSPVHTKAVLIIFLSNHLVAFGPSQAGQSGARDREDEREKGYEG